MTTTSTFDSCFADTQRGWKLLEERVHDLPGDPPLQALGVRDEDVGHPAAGEMGHEGVPVRQDPLRFHDE